MKNIYLWIVLFLSISWVSSCNQIDEWTQFDIEYNESVNLSATTGINLPIDLPTPPITTNSESEFEVNNTAKNLVEKINLKTLKLNITSPSDSDFSFLNSIEVYISAEGMPETKIAWKNDIPNNQGKELKLEVSDTNLKDYILKDEIKLRLKTLTDEILGKDHTIDVHSVFFVDARILGQ